jgi:hypothetical protein
MSKKPSPPPPPSPSTPSAANPPSTGFVSVETILHECRDRNGRSATLEKWSARLKELLNQFRAENKVPKASKEAQAVEKAFELAQELIQTVRNEAMERAASNK